MWPYTTSVRHHHEHKHGLNGSIAVNPERAVAAFEKALVAFDTIVEKYKDQIKEDDDALHAHRREIEKEDRERLDEYIEKCERVSLAREKRDSLLKKERSSFFGLKDYEKRELKEATRQANEYFFYPYLSGAYRFFGMLTSEEIQVFRDSIETQLAQCAVAIDCSHLEPHWAANIYRIEQNVLQWLENRHPFDKYAKEKK